MPVCYNDSKFKFRPANIIALKWHGMWLMHFFCLLFNEVDVRCFPQSVLILVIPI